MDEIKCASKDCQATIKNNKWDRIRGGVTGWFFSKDKDESFCPVHVPQWVADWRAGRVGWK